MPISVVDEPLLDVSGVVSGYGKIVVLHGIDFVVRPGELVALLGPNGAGKTTLLRTISGLLPVGAGAIRFQHRDGGHRALLLPAKQKRAAHLTTTDEKKLRLHGIGRKAGQLLLLVIKRISRAQGPAAR